MRPDPVKVPEIFARYLVEMALAQDEDEIQALASDAPKEALHTRIRRFCWVQSNCVESQVAVAGAAGASHGARRRRMALRMVSSLCMQATRATFLGLWAVHRRW